MKLILLASTSIVSASLFGSVALAAPCTPNANGTFTSSNATNNGGCSIASVAPTIGDTSVWNVAFIVYSQGINRTMTVENDLTTTVKGIMGFSVYGTAPTAFSTFDASGRTINLTIENLTANASLPIGDNIAKGGVGVSHGGTMTIGTLNLTMLNLPNGNDGSSVGSGQQFEHYGVVVGSNVYAAETAAFNGYQSKAIFDNLNIKMQSTNSALNMYPLLAGIRVIQGTSGSSGNGATGYVEVKNDLAIDINATSNDAIGIYISGSEQNGVVPEVRLHNSDIKIKSTSSRANAIRLGKTASIGTGEGRLSSTGHMEIDTLQAANDAAIDIIWQGAVLDADADTSSTTINAGREALTVSGNASQATAQTVTSFNNLVATTASTTANLINVANGQNDYRLNIRGTDSDIQAASAGWLLNVAGTQPSPSAVTFNFAAGKMTGLVNKAAPSTLNMAVTNGAQWILQEKAGASSSNTASFTQLDLGGEAQVAAYGAGTGNAAFVLSGNVASDNGILNLSGPVQGTPGVAGDVLTIDGNYTGTGGTLWLDTVLGDDSSVTDKLVVTGDTAGDTFVKVMNAGGSGAQTVFDGIKIVEVGGNSAAGAFTLLGDYTHNGESAVGIGLYAYKLRHGTKDGADMQDWYLRSEIKPVDPTPEPEPEPKPEPEPEPKPEPKPDPKPEPKPEPAPTPEPEPKPEAPLYRASVPVYEDYAQSLLGLNGVPTLQQRVGNRFWAGKGNRVVVEGADPVGAPYAATEEAGVAVEGNGVWGRIEGAHNRLESALSRTGVDHTQDVFKMQAGIDGMLAETENGKLIGGVTVHYTHGKTETGSIHDADNGGGEISTDGYGFGGTLTWYGENGFYLDAQGQVTWYRSDLSYDGGDIGLIDGNKGFGYALSIEGGKRIALDPEWSLTPQAQFVYSSVDFDSFTDPSGLAVNLDKGDSLQGRLALTLDHETSWQNSDGMLDRAHVYGITNLYYEFLDGTRVDVAGVGFANRKDRLWGGIGLGGSYNWNNDKYSVYGEGLVNTSLNNFGDSYSVKGTMGFRVKW